MKKAIDTTIPTTIYTVSLFKRTLDLNLPNLQILDLFSTWGDVNVFTTFDEGLFGARAPINSERVFYLWDLDWHSNGLSYDICKEIIDKSDRFYCRAESHQKAIKNYFGVEPKIMTTFDMKELYGTKRR